LKPGDLVVIQNQDVIESFICRDATPEDTLLGVLVEFDTEDPDDPNDDVWIVLVNSQLYKMLRWEFEPCNKTGRVVV
jgi:hypothetical protein